jgi:hypothetical protein
MKKIILRRKNLNKMKNQRVKNLNMKSNQSKMLPKRKMSLKMRCINKINQ